MSSEIEYEKHRNPVIRVGKLKLDRDSVMIALVNLAAWVGVWGLSGMTRTLGKDYVFTGIFVVYMLYVLANMFSAGSTSGSVVYELNILLTVEQMISILLGSVVLFATFSHTLPIHAGCKPVVLSLIFSIAGILAASSMWVNLWNSGQAFRAVRKLKQGFYNIALALFLIICILILKGYDCSQLPPAGPTASAAS